jgi:hypothetical protein
MLACATLVASPAGAQQPASEPSPVHFGFAAAVSGGYGQGRRSAPLAGAAFGLTWLYRDAATFGVYGRTTRGRAHDYEGLNSDFSLFGEISYAPALLARRVAVGVLIGRQTTPMDFALFGASLRANLFRAEHVLLSLGIEATLAPEHHSDLCRPEDLRPCLPQETFRALLVVARIHLFD